MTNETQTASSMDPGGLETAEAWRAALSSEVASAGTCHDVSTIRRLVQSYGILHYDDEAMHLLTRSLRFQDANPHVIAMILDLLVRQRALNKLTPIVSLASRLNDKPEPLRCALATAYSELGQVEQAAAEWCALLRQPSVNPAIWPPLALFLNRHGDVNGIGQLLDDKRLALQTRDPDPHAMYCLLRVQFDRPRSDARKIVNRIRPTSLADPELQLSLGIMAFRLGAYARARQEIERAHSLKPGWDVAANILRTIASFAGKETQRMPMTCLHPRILDAANTEAAATAPDRYAWGAIQLAVRNVVKTHPEKFANVDDRLLEVRPNADVVATYSILPDSKRSTDRLGRPGDPLEVLPFVDWSVPHLMVLRKAGESVLHAFVGVPGHREWYWEEVSVNVNVVEDRTPASVAHRGEIWRDARQEIRDRASEEEPQ